MVIKKIVITAERVLTGNDSADMAINFVSALLTREHFTVTETQVCVPWPTLKLGDEFEYKGERFVFVSMKSENKARCFKKTNLVKDAVLQPIYFHTDKRDDITFI